MSALATRGSMLDVRAVVTTNHSQNSRQRSGTNYCKIGFTVYQQAASLILQRLFAVIFKYILDTELPPRESHRQIDPMHAMVSRCTLVFNLPAVVR